MSSTNSTKQKDQESTEQNAAADQGKRLGWKQTALDILDAYRERDPAARSRLEVALTSTGLHAVMWHHMCHWLWNCNMFLLARMVANIGRWLFAVEIHPKAKVGKRLFIDHGSGIVIGMTSEIGDDVSIYQGVTLGGVTQEVKGKRHPTLEDRVIVGAGAKVLGPVTIGSDARVGSNAVVVKDVKAGCTVVGVPAHTASAKQESKAKQGFVAYGSTCDEENDYEKLKEEVKRLSEKVKKLSK